MLLNNLQILSDQPITLSVTKKDDVAATDNLFFGYNQDAATATAAADNLFFGHNQNAATDADNIFRLQPCHCW